jgi:hypothetical protein
MRQKLPLTGMDIIRAEYNAVPLTLTVDPFSLLHLFVALSVHVNVLPSTLADE